MMIPMSHANDLAPALIWGGDSSSSSSFNGNPLARTSSSDFQKIVENKIGSSSSSPPVVVFIKEKLCNEDITRNPSKDLKELNTIENLQFYPSVESSLTAFEKLSSYNQSTEDKPSSISDGQLVFTYVTDLETVVSTYKNLKELNPNIITALVGESCIHSKTERRKRAVNDNQNSTTNPFIFPGKFTSRVLLYTSQPIMLMDANFTAKQINLTMDNLKSAKDINNGTQSTIVSMDFNTEGNPTLKLKFINEYPGYYALKEIEYLKNGQSSGFILKPNDIIDVPQNFSYHCGPGVNFTNKNEVGLFFTNIQIEFDAVNSTFSEAYDCVGFMSIPILSGIFVTLIMALIMIWGISIIMDIRTMDRFDDPKGKTITISASE